MLSSDRAQGVRAEWMTLDTLTTLTEEACSSNEDVLPYEALGQFWGPIKEENAAAGSGPLRACPLEA